jgi:histidinol-phosphatase (PHP family)
MEEYVERALELGLEEIGFSGHYPYPDSYPDPPENCNIPADSFGEYLDGVRSIQSKYISRIAVRIGAEFDYLGPEYSVHPMRESKRLNLDFCLCSVHIVDGVIVDFSPDDLRAGLAVYDGGIDRLYHRYWECMLETCRPGWCTTLGHLDLIKKFSHEPDLRPSRQPLELIEKVLDTAAESGTVMEINTSGWDKPCAEQYPSMDILRMAVTRGVKITAGSDSHTPGDVGRKFDRLRGLLGELGVTRLAGFEKLKMNEKYID